MRAGQGDSRGQPWHQLDRCGLLGACIVLVAALLVLTARQKGMGMGNLPCSPSSLHGMARIIGHSRGLVERMRYSGATSDTVLRGYFRGSLFGSQVEPVPGDNTTGRKRFVIAESKSSGPQEEPEVQAEEGETRPQVNSLGGYPAVLHPITLGAVIVVLGGAIVALELLLRRSNANFGLGDAGADDMSLRMWAPPFSLFAIRKENT